MSMKARIQLIRPLNIVILALSQLACFRLFVPSHSDELLRLFYVVLSSCLTAAAGYIVNDIFDKDTDAVSKPHRPLVRGALSATQAWIYYFTFLASSLLTAYFSENPALLFIVFLINGALFMYAAVLKRMALLGNLIVSGMVYMSFALGNLWVHPLREFVSGLALLAFIVTLYRELLKTNEDFEGDNAAGFKTLPVRIGLQRSHAVAVIFGLVSGLFLIACGFRLVSFIPIPEGFHFYGFALFFSGFELIFTSIYYRKYTSEKHKIPASFWPKLAMIVMIVALFSSPIQ